MKEKLKDLLNNAYAPYSNFPVSCIVVTNDGTEFKGVNVENAAYGSTICAERNAILNAITNGYRKGDFKEIHIMNASDKLAYPCFACRQVLIEFMEPSTMVYVYSNKEVKSHTLEELTPKVFDKENL